MAKISDPIVINKKTVKNRLTMAPTVKFDMAGPDGKATKEHIAHYRARAEHGCGLICVEATAVTPEGRFCKAHMGLWEDGQIEGHKRITDACHEFGATVLIQINHTGIMSNPECGPAIGPSAVPTRNPEVLSREMTVSEIHEIQEAFLRAAIRAKEAGYDGVQLHGCHSYLINQFAASKINSRTDEYGGSVVNRARFGSEIIRRVREECGDDFIISIRITGCDPDVATAIAVAEEYVKAGCDFLQVSTGFEFDDPALKADGERYNSIVKMGILFHEHFKGRIPVACVNTILDPELAKYLVENDLTDCVDLGRALLADPAFSEACLAGADYVKCFDCPRCQYGPGTPHKCPAAMKRGVNEYSA